MEKLSKLFHNCAFTVHYEVVGHDVNYAFVEDGSTLYIYFEGSKDIKAENGWIDWFRNFFFFPRYIRPYEEMKIPYKVHGGFCDAWDEVKHIVKDKILEQSDNKLENNPEANAKIENIDITNEYKWKEIIIVGYSHGGALSGLCFEFCNYWRNDLAKNGKLTGFGFESPRFLHCYKVPKKLKDRWNNYFVIRNNKDLVTHCPPWILKFCHVGKLVKMKTDTSNYRKPKCIGAHYQDAVEGSLKEYEEKYGDEFYKL